jgi:hypothetical protein
VSFRPDARQTSIIRLNDVFIPSGPFTVSRRFYPACIRLDVSAARSDASGTRPVSESFQVSITERLINCPDDVVSLPDVGLHKVRIAVQISPSGRQSALVRTRVLLIWKLPIRLQPSGRLPLMVRTRAYLIWKLRVEVHPSGRASPMVRTSVSHRPDAALKQERFSAKFSENPVAQLLV